MRCMIRKLSILAAALMIMAVPVLAEEGTVKTMMDNGQKVEKNECLLAANNCGNQVDSIQQRIERIRKEIGRGTDVYTTDELRRLNRELENANKLLDGLVNGA